jgi:prolyl oligopeptidase
VEKLTIKEDTTPETSMLKVANNNRCFYLKYVNNESVGKLFFRNGFEGEEKLLYDPSYFMPKTSNNYLINYINPNEDGSKIAIGLTKNDEEFSKVIFLDVATELIMTDTIDHCWPSEFGGILWLPDNSGIIYLNIPVIDNTSENSLLNSESVLYKFNNRASKKKE